MKFSDEKMQTLLSKIVTLEFKPFDKLDWDAFAGCTSANPLIAYDESTESTFIIDGDILVISFDGSEEQYALTKIM